ncbi:MAG: DUF502 domain-containing protein [Bacteroidia bacterium]|nr:DUF502 domain-containing protein [Bacteroidia bacterium]
MKKLINYFLQGLLIIVPTAVTFYVVYKGVVWLDNLIPFSIPIEIPGYEKFDLPGMGIVAIVMLITLMGYFATGFITKPLFVYLELALERTPLLKIIYTAVKDLVDAFVGEKKRFNNPVLVKLDEDKEVYRIGFITSDDVSHLGMPDTSLAVYLPFSYAINGILYIVPASMISPLEHGGAETMKYVISGGVTKI